VPQELRAQRPAAPLHGLVPAAELPPGVVGVHTKTPTQIFVGNFVVYPGSQSKELMEFMALRFSFVEG
jgi:hypothetical protein